MTFHSIVIPAQAGIPAFGRRATPVSAGVTGAFGG